MRPARDGVGFAGLTLGLVLVMAPAAALAQGAGSSASTVLRIAPAPRALALGNALVAVQDPFSMEYNPAAVAAEAATVAAAYQKLPVGVVAGAASLALPVHRAAVLAFSLRFVDYGEIEVIESDPAWPVGRPTGATADGGEVTAAVGGVVRLGRLRLGAAARWLRLDVAGLSDQALAADAGVFFRPAPWLDLGVAAQNMGQELEAGRAAPLPATVRAGAAVTGRVAGLDALLSMESRRREERTGFGAGLEVRGGSGGVQALGRLGFETRPDPGDAFGRFVFGGGVRVDRLSLDLAYRPLGPLGSTRQIGLGYRF